MDTEGGQTAAEVHPEGPEAEEAPRDWEVRTPSDADFALMRVAQAARQLEELAAQEEAAIARIRARTAALKREHLRTQEFFTAHLRKWAEAHRSEVQQGKKKSRNFLHGSVGFRAVARRLEKVDGLALLAWAKTQPQAEALVRVKEEANWEAIKAGVTLVAPPGTRWVEATEVFEVKPVLPEEE